MIRFPCPTCKTILQAPAQQAGAPIACSKCKSQMRVPSPVSIQPKPGTVPATAVASAQVQPASQPNADTWYYSRDKKKYGPFSWVQMKGLAETGRLQPTDMVMEEGTGKWAAASAVFFSPVTSGNDVKDSKPPVAVHPPTSCASSASEGGSSPPSVIALSDLESKWFGVYKRDLKLVELVIVELFHRLVPKNNSLYTFPNIPEKKLSNAKGTYANVTASELLLGLWDDTVFGSARDGYLITTQGVYWHNSGEDDGQREYAGVQPGEVQAKAEWATYKVFLTPTNYVKAATLHQDGADGMAKFVRHAVAFTLSSKGHESTTHAAAWSALSEAKSKGRLDVVLPEVLQRVLKEETETTAAAKEPLSKRTFQRTEDLDRLQTEIAAWFKAKNYTVTTDKANDVRAVLAGKESGLRTLVGARQKFLVRIERHGTGYDVEIKYGDFKAKSAGGNLATFLVNYVTVGVPYIAGSIESQGVQDEFWKWMELRSGTGSAASDKSGPMLQTHGQVADPAKLRAEDKSTKIVNCVVCHESYSLDLTKYGGKKIKCKKCQGTIEVPMAQADDEFEVVGESPSLPSATTRPASPHLSVPPQQTACPKCGFGYGWDGLICTHCMSQDEVISALSKAIAKAPTASAYWEARASQYMKMEEYDLALFDLTNYIRLNPTNPEIFFARGYIFIQKQRPAEAEADFNEAIRLNPSNPTYLAGRGALLNARGEYEKAVADYTEAVRLEPTNGQYQLELREVQQELKTSVEEQQKVAAAVQKKKGFFGSVFSFFSNWQCPRCGQRSGKETHRQVLDRRQEWRTTYENQQPVQRSFNIETYRLTLVCDDCGNQWHVQDTGEHKA